MHTVMSTVQILLFYINNNIIQFEELFAAFHVRFFIYHYHTMHIWRESVQTKNQK